jgi:hypothetical protein
MTGPDPTRATPTTAGTPAGAAISHDQAKVDQVVRSLRRRAILYYVFAGTALVAIIGSLLYGAFSFERASRDAVAESNGGVAAKGYQGALDERANTVTTYFSDVQSTWVAKRYTEIVRSNFPGPVVTSDQREKAQRELLVLYESVVRRNAPIRATQSGQPRNYTDEEVLRQFVVPVMALDSTRTFTDPRARLTVYLTSTISSRLGTVVFTLFLVQILVSLYRYTTRLAAFCSSRADALVLLQNRAIEELAILTPLLAADAVEHGNLPASPIQAMLETLTKIAPSR